MTTAVHDVRPLKIEEKLRVTVACAIGLALFASVGWTVARPADPRAPITLVLDGGGWLTTWGSVLGLAAVTSAVATAAAAPIFIGSGMLATAVGLAAMSLRGGTMTELLLYRGADAAQRQALAQRLMLETLLWFAAIGVAAIVGATVRRWLGGEAMPLDEADASAGDAKGGSPKRRGDGSGGAAGTKSSAAAASGAGGWLNRSGFSVSRGLRVLRDGAGATLVSLGAAWFLITVVIGRTSVAWIERGQVLFAVGASFFCAVMLARVLFKAAPLSSCVIAVPLLACVGYAWGYIRPIASNVGYYADLASTPPSDLFRPLPIEYVGMGVVGVVLGYWFAIRSLSSPDDDEEETPATAESKRRSEAS